MERKVEIRIIVLNMVFLIQLERGRGAPGLGKSYCLASSFSNRKKMGES